MTLFAILPPVLQGDDPRLRVGGASVFLPARDKGSAARKPVIGRRDGKWAYLGELDTLPLEGKRPGVQGPIDDAFTTPFLCVRGTGKPWNNAVQAWSDAALRRFVYEWDRYFRGTLLVKDDIDVTDADVRRCNLILFGDPGSNRWISRVLPKLPIQWTQEEVRIGNDTFAANKHAPVLIQPNPLRQDRYVVINSGHTFNEKELASLNYLLFPRLGDWAVLKVGAKAPTNPAEALDEEVVRAGYFDEHWRAPGGKDSR